MRLPRLLAPVAALAALAFPPAPAQAVNTLAYTFTVDCRSASGASTGPLVTLPSGRYVVTVAGACSYSDAPPAATVPVDTCVHPVNTLPCVDTQIDVNNVPRAVCIAGVGFAYEVSCAGGGRGVFVPGCGAAFTVVVNEQCLSTVPNVAGVVNHGGGAMTARAVDVPGYYGDNVGTFVVTAVWTPL